MSTKEKFAANWAKTRAEIEKEPADKTLIEVVRIMDGVSEILKSPAAKELNFPKAPRDPEDSSEYAENPEYQ